MDEGRQRKTENRRNTGVFLSKIDSNGQRWTLMDGEMVGRDGIEPSTNGLKVHCSTAELTAPASTRQCSRALRDNHSPLPLAGEGKG